MSCVVRTFFGRQPVAVGCSLRVERPGPRRLGLQVAEAQQTGCRQNRSDAIFSHGVRYWSVFPGAIGSRAVRPRSFFLARPPSRLRSGRPFMRITLGAPRSLRPKFLASPERVGMQGGPAKLRALCRAPAESKQGRRTSARSATIGTQRIVRDTICDLFGTIPPAGSRTGRPTGLIPSVRCVRQRGAATATRDYFRISFSQRSSDVRSSSWYLKVSSQPQPWPPDG